MKTVPIPEKMEKYYGKGTMLHPDQQMVEELLQKIPTGKVVTIDALCQKMSRDYHTDATCPMRTGNFIKTITEGSLDQDSSLPFWRVIRKNHLLINSKLTELCVDELTKEGIEVIRTNKGDYKIIATEAQLFDL